MCMAPVHIFKGKITFGTVAALSGSCACPVYVQMVIPAFVCGPCSYLQGGIFPGTVAALCGPYACPVYKWSYVLNYMVYTSVCVGPLFICLGVWDLFLEGYCLPRGILLEGFRKNQRLCKAILASE